jgi:hypothetical protein
VDLVVLFASAGGVVAVGIAVSTWNKRYCINKLKKAGAFSPEKAVTREGADIEADPWSRTTLNTLVKKGKLGMTEDGRYYIRVQNNRP